MSSSAVETPPEAAKRRIEKGSVIQVDPTGRFASHQGGFWAGRLLVVSEPKNFGCQAYAQTDAGGLAYIRLSWVDFELVGHAEWAAP